MKVLLAKIKPNPFRAQIAGGYDEKQIGRIIVRKCQITTSRGIAVVTLPNREKGEATIRASCPRRSRKQRTLETRLAHAQTGRGNPIQASLVAILTPGKARQGKANL